ncbi:MAG: YciI family protein [Alphaproteobacteria bacterium]|nr:YciI family protein [Alphaproteobacteria bacterium]
MNVLIKGMDKKGALEKRKEVRPRHLEYYRNAGISVVTGGPLLDEETGDPIGSMLIVEVDKLAQAKELAHNDPYNLDGVFESVEVIPVNLLLSTVKES